MSQPRLTDRPLADELPRLLEERGITLRSLARAIGVDHGHLSRIMRHQRGKTAGPELARRVAEAFDLPPDFFPEYREAIVVQRVRRDADLRDELYRRLISG